MEKQSCISQLKDLADSLSDRDINLKKCMSSVKKIIHNDDLTDEQKVEAIKTICKKNGK
jgi:hypothetical protein